MTRWLVVSGSVVVLASVEATAAAAGAHDALSPAGPQAERLYALWIVMLVVCAIVFMAIVAALGFALWRSRRGDSSTPPEVDAPELRERSAVRSVVAATGV